MRTCLRLLAVAAAGVVLVGCAASGDAGPADQGHGEPDTASTDVSVPADIDVVTDSGGPGGPDVAPFDVFIAGDGGDVHAVGPDIVGPDAVGPDIGGPDVDTPPIPGGPPVSLSSGGASVSSESFQLTVSVGAPLPVGAVASENYELRLGPQAE